MKILKRPDTNWSCKYTCTNCTAELEIKKSDVSYRHYDGDQRDPSYDAYYANCPLCSAAISILNKSIPQAVQIEIQRGKPLYPTPVAKKWNGDGPLDR